MDSTVVRYNVETSLVEIEDTDIKEESCEGSLIEIEYDR